MYNRGKKLSFSAKKLKACRRIKSSKEDWISELPNEIIIYILSLLTLKEAGQTSVLSERWKYVWAYVPVLNFDAPDAIFKIRSEEISLEVEKETSLELEKHRYLNWVNQVVGSYRGLFIDEFRVRFPLNDADTDSIDNWLNFAIEKRVKSLEFNFSSPFGAGHPEQYTFRNLLPVCNFLTSLRLIAVDIHGDILKILLKNCPSLEYFSLKYSYSLVSFEMTEETPNLKYLEVDSCIELKHIEINAPNLVSFKYNGFVINVPFTKIPKLTQLFIGGLYCNYVMRLRNLLTFSSYLCQLEALTLDMTFKKTLLKSFRQFPVCKKLKQLELIIDTVDGSPLCFLPIIKACPFLHRFVLKLELYDANQKSDLLEVEAQSHHHLKIIELCGFVGWAPDLEFALYLAKSFVALEKIIIDPRLQPSIGTPYEFVPNKEIERARKNAVKKLGPFLKPGIDLVIL